MYDAAFVIGMLSIAILLISLVGALFKRLRSEAIRVIGVAFGVLVLCIVAVTVLNISAGKRGFDNVPDEVRAQEQGITDPAEWARRKAVYAENQAKKAAQKAAEEARLKQQQLAIEAEETAVRDAKVRDEEAARQAEIQAKVATQLKEAQAAGFTNFEDYQSAKVSGLNATEWKKRGADAALTALLDRLKKADRSIVFIEDADMDDVRGLFVKVKTKGLDGGTLDFHAFGNAVSALAAELRKEKTPYVKMRVGLVIPAQDKYGNAEDANGGDIDWKLSELAKVNLQAGPEYVLVAADKVRLKHLGAEIARYYCARTDLRDPRYCRKPF